MKKIWKYELDARKPAMGIELPWNAEVVKVAQGQMWIEGSFNSPKLYVFNFQIIGTGHDVPDGFTYVGTYFEDPFVWHVYKANIGVGK